jgi:hypothetical protein
MSERFPFWLVRSRAWNHRDSVNGSEFHDRNRCIVLLKIGKPHSCVKKRFNNRIKKIKVQVRSGFSYDWFEDEAFIDLDGSTMLS